MSSFEGVRHLMQFLRRFRKQALITIGLVLVITGVLSIFATPGWAVASIDRGGGDNVAVAVNTRDNSSVFRLQFKMTRTNNRTVDQKNVAIAYSSCTSCQTVAGAMQVVLVMRDDVDTVTPTNVAIATNEDCTDCATLAAAYQKVISTGGPVHFTDEGNRRIAELRKRFEELRKSGHSIEDIQAQFDEIWAELNDVLATELVSADNSGKGNRIEETVLESTSESSLDRTFETTETIEPVEGTTPKSPSEAPITTAPVTTEEATLTTETAAPLRTTPTTTLDETTMPAGGTPPRPRFRKPHRRPLHL